MRPKSCWKTWHIILDDTITMQNFDQSIIHNVHRNRNISESRREEALYVPMIFSRTSIHEFCHIPLLFFALVNSLAFSTSAPAFLRSTFSFFSSISSVYMIQGTKHSKWEKKFPSNWKLLLETTSKTLHASIVTWSNTI